MPREGRVKGRLLSVDVHISRQNHVPDRRNDGEICEPLAPDQNAYGNRFQIHNGPPHDSNYGYSYAKRLIDITNRAYFDQFGHIFTSIVPCNIYGPNDNFHPTASHVIPGMIQRLYGIMNGESDTSQEERVFTVYGTGKPLRQFIYSHDLAKLAIWVLREYESVEPVILSGNASGSNPKLIAITQRHHAFQLTRPTR